MRDHFVLSHSDKNPQKHQNSVISFFFQGSLQWPFMVIFKGLIWPGDSLYKIWCILLRPLFRCPKISINLSWNSHVLKSCWVMEKGGRVVCMHYNSSLWQMQRGLGEVWGDQAASSRSESPLQVIELVWKIYKGESFQGVPWQQPGGSDVTDGKSKCIWAKARDHKRLCRENGPS